MPQTFENHMAAKRADVEATLQELLQSGYFAPLDAHTAQNFKQNLTKILSDFYDRAAEEGRYLEIMEPTLPEGAVLVIAEGPITNRKPFPPEAEFWVD